MKLKLSQIVNSVQALQRLGEEKLPIKIAYSIQRNIRLLQPELEGYEKSRIGLIKEKYGEKDGENFKVSDNKLEDFTKELVELQSVEVDMDIHKINLDNSIQMSANDLLFLSWMFIDPVEEDK